MTLHIPNIDISDGLDSVDVIAQLAKACEDWGFFQITGHGIDQGLRRQFFSVMASFFELPRVSKLGLSRTETNFWGYYDRELTKNKLDRKEIYDIDANLDNLTNNAVEFPVPWPDELPKLRAIVIEWLLQNEALSQKLLGALCVALGESSTILNPFFIKNHTSFLRFNYYPAELDRSAIEDGIQWGDLGIHPHTDAGALTVLAQDRVPGLQVKKEDTWHTVIPIENSFIINIGDMVQVWSNDRYIAPEHRVLASSDSARYSAPYFYNPSYETLCSPLLKAGEISAYKPIPWHEFRSGRAAGDYSNLGEEIQISWYRN